MSITHESIPRKGKDAGPEKTSPALRAGRVGGAAGFTAEELADMARADAEIDDAPDILTPEERALSRALDRQAAAARLEKKRAREAAARARETPEQRAARLARKAAYRAAHREEERARSAHYNEAHRQERREYQRAYDAAHKAEINARRRKRYAEKKRKEKEHGQ